MNLVMLIYLPLDASAFAAVCKIVAKAYRGATIITDRVDPRVVRIEVPAHHAVGLNEEDENFRHRLAAAEHQLMVGLAIQSSSAEVQS